MNDIAGRYRLLERLGSGHMGTVWRAFDARLRRTVAVKQVHVPAGLTGSQNDELVRRTMREGRIAARLQHPGLITVYDVVQDSGRPYLIMEHFPSKNLAALGTLPYPEAARIGTEAAEALAAAHESGVVHRDIKPANILVGTDGSVKITDFGISRVVEDLTATMTGMFAGTPAYLAPEVAKGDQATFASDVYSLGATLYTVIEGAPPAGSSNNPMGLLYRVASGDINPPKQAGPLTKLLTRLLSVDPATRPTMPETQLALATNAADQSAIKVIAAKAITPPKSKAAAVTPAIPAAGTAGADEAASTEVPAGESAPAPEPKSNNGSSSRANGLAAASALAVASDSAGDPTPAAAPAPASDSSEATSTPAAESSPAPATANQPAESAPATGSIPATASGPATGASPTTTPTGSGPTTGPASAGSALAAATAGSNPANGKAPAAASGPAAAPDPTGSQPSTAGPAPAISALAASAGPTTNPDPATAPAGPNPTTDTTASPDPALTASAGPTTNPAPSPSASPDPGTATVRPNPTTDAAASPAPALAASSSSTTSPDPATTSARPNPTTDTTASPAATPAVASAEPTTSPPAPATAPDSAAAPDASAGSIPAASPANSAPGAASAPPAGTTGSAPAAAGSEPQPEPLMRKRLRAVAIGAGLVAVAVVAALVTMLVNTDDTPSNRDRAGADQNTNPAAPAVDGTTTTTKPTTTTTNPAPTTTTTEQPAQPPPSAQQPNPPSSATPAAAIADYYALMPGNRDQAWNRLTPKFQNSPAGGKSGYDRFWSKISSISATDIAQTGENVVEVTLLYTYNDGSRIRERHRYVLVNQNGTWLIDTVRVLSTSPA
jgi:eukaryotic-like serine/threonine-protein kinase